MGCLTVEIKRLGGLTSTAARCDGVHALVAAGAVLTAVAAREGQLTAAVVRSGQLTASVSRCCEVGQADYLMVTPGVVWLTDANGHTATLDVYSNTDWTIE